MHYSEPFNLLVVDDNAEVRNMLQKALILRYTNALIHTAIDGRAGLEKFKGQHQDLVITDLIMPRLDGIQMAAEIRRIRPDVKIILLSGQSNFPACCESLPEAVLIDHYLQKPIVFSSLYETIERCI